MKTKIRMKANGEPDRRELRRGLKLDAAIAANDMSMVIAAAADLDAQQSELVAAITANTPVSPALAVATKSP